ncbi:MAG: thymidine phosphorylase [Gemmatimonadales bacterium]
MLVPKLIQRKRDGGSLTPEEWSALIADYTAGGVPEYQMAALVMASFLNGLDKSELSALTEAIIASGSRLEFDSDTVPIDKHSTGGVGDKVSLVLAPMVAACGVPVPMMSGRGLGHTTGTLDKLEAIPGFRTDLSLREAIAQVERIGCALIGQTDEIAPADGKLYALRDAIAAVESIPLISASIMSKKLCEGLKGLVLDVKNGSGAFIKDTNEALTLAGTMISIGELRGCKTVALITAMDRPLGRRLGNALETVEAIEALHGNGPQDLMEVTLALGSEMLVLGGVAGTIGQAHQMLLDVLETGAALRVFGQIVEAQGGDTGVLTNPDSLPRAPVIGSYLASEAGIVRRISPRPLGEEIVTLGGGRRNAEDAIDLSVGFELSVRVGDRVETGEELVRIYASSEDAAAHAIGVAGQAIEIGPEAPDPHLPLISHRVSSDGVETR